MEASTIPNWVIRYLRAYSGLVVDANGPNSLLLSIIGGRNVVYRVKLASRMSEEDARELVRREGDPRMIVATEKLTKAAREVLQVAGFSSVERKSGMTSLVGAGLLIRSEAPVSARQGGLRQGAMPGRLVGKSGVIAEVILEAGANRPLALGAAAKEAGVSKGLVSRVFRRLEGENILEVVGAGPRKTWALVNGSALLDLWAEEEHIETKSESWLYVWALNPVARYKSLTALEGRGFRWALGGVSAANAYAPHLTNLPDPHVWVDAAVPVDEVARAVGGEVVYDGGNVLIKQTERNAPLVRSRLLDSGIGVNGMRVVTPWRSVVESSASPARGEEVAAHLRGILTRHELAPS